MADDPQGDPPQTDAVYWPTGRPRAKEPPRRGGGREGWELLVHDRLKAAADEAGWRVLAVTGRAPPPGTPAGVAVYLKTLGGRVICVCCDRYQRPAANLTEVVVAIRRLVAVLKRCGVGMNALLAGLEAAPPNWSRAGQEESTWDRFRRKEEAERLRKAADERTRREAEQAARSSADQRARAEAEEQRRRAYDPFRVFQDLFGEGVGGKFTWESYSTYGPGGGTYYTPPPPPPPGWAEVLGVPANADVTAIKAAYKRLAMEHHPSRGGDTATMQAVNAAYDQAKRERGFQ